MATQRRIRTLLNGDQRVTASELDLLHTPAMQRLYDLHQLGLTDRVFIDATHSRLQHVIGVLEQVDNILNAITSNLDRNERDPIEFRSTNGTRDSFTPSELANYIRTRRRAARLMGLLHDLTHAPYGHTLEDEIELQPQKHDDPNRQAAAFYRLLCQYIGWVAQDEKKIDLVGEKESTDSTVQTQLAALLLAPVTADPPDTDDFRSYIADLGYQLVASPSTGRRLQRAPSGREVFELFSDLRFGMRALLWLDALHKDKLDSLVGTDKNTDVKADSSEDEDTSEPFIKPDGEYAFEKVLDDILYRAKCDLNSVKDIEVEPFLLQRDAFLLDVIGNTICADLLDYAKRDSHHAGLKLDYDVDRIVDNFTVVSYRRPREGESFNRFSGLDPMIRTAISIFSHKLRVDMPGELMNLLQVRFYVYQRVLFHPTKAIAGAMLGSALQLVGWKSMPLHYRHVGDAVFLDQVADVARTVLELIKITRGRKGWKTQLGSISESILKRLEGLPEIALIRACKQLVYDRREDSLGKVMEDLDAALRTLARLSARRYNRSVFRLLPNAKVAQLNMKPKQIASVFLNARKRAAAERLIERKAGIPTGSVTIHCPISDGPRKIAEILILNHQDEIEQVVPLRELGSIDQDIFQKHQDAIKAVEDMYASMWRLIVSVAPPHHERFREVNPHIGRVLYAFLSGESYDNFYAQWSEEELNSNPKIPTVPNDERKREELERLESEVDAFDGKVHLVFSDGRRRQRSVPFVEVAELAAEMLIQRDNQLRGYVEDRSAAHAITEPQLEDIISSRIRSDENTTQDSNTQLNMLDKLEENG